MNYEKIYFTKLIIVENAKTNHIFRT